MSQARSPIDSLTQLAAQVRSPRPLRVEAHVALIVFGTAVFVFLIGALGFLLVRASLTQ